MNKLTNAVFAAIGLSVGACGSPNGISRDAQAFAGITETEVITALGTEPFWSIKISGEEAVYSSPEHQDGNVFAVSRFAGNNGLGFSGQLAGEKFILTVTPGQCNDGMSDHKYPFTATVMLGDDTFEGCGYTDKQGFAENANP